MSYPSFGVLLVDDEDAFLRSMSISLERNGGIDNIVTCVDSRQVMTLIPEHNIGLVLLDLTMPHISGDTLLEKILEHHPEITVIILSGMNQLETVVKCIRKGAYDYFVKTAGEQQLIDSVKRAIHIQESRIENLAIRKQLSTKIHKRSAAFKNIITSDPGMLSVFNYLETVAVSSQPVLITGESGVGKELAAQAIHQLSNRDGELVSLNTAGLDEQVFSDTLFGHRKGAFTGAENTREGLIERAHHGTLFLDEIGDLAANLQIRLLRLLQDGEYFPLGSDKPERMTARILVATHQDLNNLQDDGRFRSDLFFRLSTHQVHIPPLRERKGDIPALLEHFLAEASIELQKNKPTVPQELYTLLENYHFPGNVRELRSLAYEAMSHHTSGMLSMKQFLKVLEKTPKTSYTQQDDSLFKENTPLPSIQELNELLVNEAMARAENNQSLAAKLLGISQPALSKRLKKRKDN
ncbi:MAG: sigma-54-dependent transcriptional regulator [Arenicella sp.]